MYGQFTEAGTTVKVLAKDPEVLGGGGVRLVVEWGKDQMISRFCCIKACRMHFAAVMWHWQHVGIRDVREDESPQATDPLWWIAFHKEGRDPGQALEGDKLWIGYIPLQRAWSVDRKAPKDSPFANMGQTSQWNSWPGLSWLLKTAGQLHSITYWCKVTFSVCSAFHNDRIWCICHK